MSTSGPELDRGERRDLYERVLRVVTHQTTPVQLPGTTARVIRQLCADYAGADPDAVDRARQAAVENGHLIDWTADGGATWRYTRCSDAALTRLARWAGDRGARDLVGRAYRARAEVRST